jgi:hypothetical protein
VGPPKAYLIVAVLLSLAQGESNKALADWFLDTSDVKKWRTKWYPKSITDDIRAMVGEHILWVQSGKFIYTPAMYLDGIILPRVFSIYDVGKISKILDSRFS